MKVKNYRCLTCGYGFVIPFEDDLPTRNQQHHPSVISEDNSDKCPSCLEGDLASEAVGDTKEVLNNMLDGWKTQAQAQINK